MTLYLESKSYKGVQAKFRQNITSTTFHQNYSFSEGLKNFKQVDHFSTTLQSLQQQENEMKKTAMSPENIAPVRDSLERLRSPCSGVPPTMATWGMFCELLYIFVNVVLDLKYVVFRNC